MLSMSWVYLLFAILFEVGGTFCMKLSDGLTRLWPTVWMFAFYGLSFSVLTLALRQIELGIAYAIWSGLGTALIACLGVIVFQESVAPVKLLGIALIIIGVVTLKIAQG